MSSSPRKEAARGERRRGAGGRTRPARSIGAEVDTDIVEPSRTGAIHRPILVLVASPRPPFGRRVATRLRAERNIEVITSTASPQVALRVAARLSPGDVAVIDESFNEVFARDLTREVCELPNAPGVVALLGANDRSRAAQALQSGAIGFVPVTASLDEVVRATRFVAQGLGWITKSLWSV